MPFHLQVFGGEVEEEEEEESFFWSNGTKSLLLEPTSVLDKRSTSPTTSTTTLSSPHLGPTASSSGDVGPTPLPAPAPAPWDHTFLHWMMGDDGSPDPTAATAGFGIVEPSFGPFDQSVLPPGPPAFFPDPAPQFDPAAYFLPVPPQPKAAPDEEFVASLLRAAELVRSGDPTTARGILARLNQQLPSPIGTPLLRSAFYFKESLLLLATNAPPVPTLTTPLDVLLKLGTYKAFSELSPVPQFANFTSIQSLLEDLNASDRIHVVDFDVGLGSHWSSFIQELSHRRAKSLKITAFLSQSSHHPLELHLTRDNLAHFAADLNLRFELNILSLDSFDALPLSADEAVAVNLPVGCVDPRSLPTVLRLVRQLNPRIVVSVDHGFDGDLVRAVRSCAALLESVDASGANPDVANKIERYLVRPRIEAAVLGREKAPHWKAMFAAAGFVPAGFSNFTETQAEYVLKRVQVGGFQVEKRQASLCLCWQRAELVSVSAWRC